MLERIYIDNYKCLVNFEYKPGQVQLLLGGNGCGKSTVFEVLGLVRSLIVDGETTSKLFGSRTRTRWQTSTTQTVELEVSGNGGLYVYKLAVKHLAEDETGLRNSVGREELTFDGAPLLKSRNGYGVFFIDHTEVGPQVMIDSQRSVAYVLSQRTDSQKLTWFRDWVARLYRIQINPYAMSAVSNEEAPHPVGDLSNYASWYRHLSQEKPGVTRSLDDYLKPIIGGFEQLSLPREADTIRVLKARIRDISDKATVAYSFDELSEGQRALVCLYTLLALMKETEITLCIDEPDNFVMLSEIQPWLMELQEQAEHHQSQVLVISHHPELIDYLAPLGAVRFFRAPDGPARVTSFAPDSDKVLPPSEVVARGWESE